jgi:glutamine amidotransferase
MVSILNYGFGNIGSIVNILKKINIKSNVITTSNEILDASNIILPGIGKFDHAINQLNTLDLRNSLNESVLIKKTPILGICLGMQLMTNYSEEGIHAGFGWIDASTKKIDTINNNLKVPHMGWNTIDYKKNKKDFVFDEIEELQKFYFVHSYAINCNSAKDILATTNYGLEFVSAFSKENITGVQFHPEKSHKYGINFFKNYFKMLNYD